MNRRTVGAALLLWGLSLWICPWTEAQGALSAGESEIAEVVDSAKQVLAELQPESWAVFTTQAPYEYFNLSPVPLAHAFDGRMNCFFAGWPSQLVTGAGGKKVCTHPKAFQHYRARSSLKCAGDQLLCNPLLFGQKSASEGLCASMATLDDRQRAFSQCEAQFEAQGAARFDYLKKLSEPEKAELNQTLELVAQICMEGSVGIQKQTAMCSRFTKKLEAFKSKSKSKTNTKIVTTKPIPSRSVSAQNESCAHCDIQTTTPQVHAQQTGVLSQIAEKLSVEQKNEPKTKTEKSPEAMYRRIRERYISGAQDLNGECHPYSQLPPEEKQAFFIGLYGEELLNIASPEYFSSNAKPSLSHRQVVQRLGRAIGWTPTDEEQWTLKLSNTGVDRVALAQELTQQLIKKMDSECFRTETLSRASDYLKKLGAADCDFVSEESLINAIRSLRATGSQPPKQGLLTVLDRQKDDLKKNPIPRRMLVVDLESEKVLFHSEARFGDGDTRGTMQKEDSRCSNQDGTNLSPQGLFVTTRTRKMNTLKDADATFIRRPDSRSEFRALAFHEVSGGSFGRFQGADSFGKVFSKWTEPESFLKFLRRSQNQVALPLGYTDGCVGVPKEHIQKVNRLIEGGSFVYFHCQ